MTSDSSAENFELPPILDKASGGTRHVGFEFEFAGVGLEKTAEIIRSICGGHTKKLDRFVYRVEGTSLGDFQLEADSTMLKKKKWEKYLHAVGIDSASPQLTQKIEDWIARAAENVIPFEVVSPPIPIREIKVTDRIREALRKAGAEGTFSHFYTAFGMQFNPELPTFDVDYLLNMMRAFHLMYDELKRTTRVPIARKALSFIDPFPKEYIEKVMKTDYAPNLQEFMTDYLKMNPTRNRPLDWLPLFDYLDHDLVFSFDVEKHLVNPRPALHYRHPSSLMDEADWTIASDWNKWVQVEKLASDPARIALLTEKAFKKGSSWHPSPSL